MINLLIRDLLQYLLARAQAAVNAQMGIRQSIGWGGPGIVSERDGKRVAIFPVNLHQAMVESIALESGIDLPMDGLVYFDDLVVGTVAGWEGTPRCCPMVGPREIRIAGDIGEKAKPHLHLHIVLR